MYFFSGTFFFNTDVAIEMEILVPKQATGQPGPVESFIHLVILTLPLTIELLQRP